MQKVYITNIQRKVLAGGTVKYTYGEVRDATTKKLIKGGKLSMIMELVYETNCATYDCVKLIEG